MTTQVPKIAWNSNGIVLPTEQEILAGRLADINAAFGGTLNTTNLETPQGQLASSETAIIGDANDTFAKFVNQVDPTYADGLMQDGIARIYFLNRKPAIPTTVTCQCVGIAGTVIPAGAKIADADGNIYIASAPGTIPESGTIDLTFQALETGPLACAANTLTKIYQVIPGWDTVNNSSPGVAGQDVESRADFEVRRYASVFRNSLGSVNAIYAEVYECPGVIDVFVAENDTSSPVNRGSSSYSLAAKSVYVAVVGGYPNDIAAAIWRKKSLGCAMNGGQTVTVQDRTGYAIPYPEYTIKYEIPDALPIKFAVALVSSTSLPANAADLIKAAIILAFSGGDGGQRERIGKTVYASRFYSVVAAAVPGIEIVDILIGTTTATEFSVAVGIDQTPTVQASDIAVTVS